MSKKKRGKRSRKLKHYKPPKIADDMQELLQRLGTMIDRVTGEGVIFSLFLFDGRRNPKETQHYFVSSVEREDVIVQTANWLAMQLAYAEIAREPTPADTPSDDVELIKKTTEWLASILEECTLKLPPPYHYWETKKPIPPIPKERADETGTATEE